MYLETALPTHCRVLFERTVATSAPFLLSIKFYRSFQHQILETILSREYTQNILCFTASTSRLLISKTQSPLHPPQSKVFIWHHKLDKIPFNKRQWETSGNCYDGHFIFQKICCDTQKIPIRSYHMKNTQNSNTTTNKEEGRKKKERERERERESFGKKRKLASKKEEGAEK